MNILYYYDNDGCIKPYQGEKKYRISDICDIGNTMYANIEGCPVELDPDDGIWVAERTTENRANWGRKFIQLEVASDQNVPVGNTPSEWIKSVEGKSWTDIEDMDLTIDDTIEDSMVIDVSDNVIKDTEIIITKFSSSMEHDGIEAMASINGSAEHDVWMHTNIIIYKLSEDLYSARGDIECDSVSFDKLREILKEYGEENSIE